MRSAFWRRLDDSGHDACMLEGRHFRGAAVFKQDEMPAFLSYELQCDDAWRSLRGVVSGSFGGRAIHVTFERTDGRWMMNGEHVPEADGCVDLDFSFTPATNYSHLHRVALKVGESADVPVAWFNLEEHTLSRLPQHYERIGASRYRYDAPTVGYHAELQIAENGFVALYPELWVME